MYQNTDHHENIADQYSEEAPPAYCDLFPTGFKNYEESKTNTRPEEESALRTFQETTLAGRTENTTQPLASTARTSQNSALDSKCNSSATFLGVLDIILGIVGWYVDLTIKH